MKKLATASALVCVLPLVSCTIGANTDLFTITVTPSNTSIVLPGTQQFTATGTYSDGRSADITNSVTWSSDTTAAATIDKNGLATGVAYGKLNITATLGSVSGSTVFTVKRIDVYVAGQYNDPVTVTNVYSYWKNGQRIVLDAGAATYSVTSALYVDVHP